jgi:tetratricopeptide (TPR) repeat protein
MHPPKIFISATSGDLRSVRQVVKEALLTINCHPVEQTNFEPDARTVENMLRGKIGECQALIHICGLRYGAEPDVASLPPGAPRRSYTQMEYHLGRQLQEARGDDHFRVYTFICPDDFPYDPEPDVELPEKRDLQRAHRTRLFDDPHLREKPQDADDLRLRILTLQEQVLALKQEQSAVKAEVLKNRRLGLKAFAVILLLLGGIFGGMTLLQRGQQEILSTQKLDAPALRARLTESSERTLQQDLTAAAQAANSTDRQRLREAAEAAHATRLTRIADLATRLSELFAAGQASPILVEMLRILEEEGVDAALVYEETQRPALLESMRVARQMDRERDRIKLQPVLKAAEIQATKGDSPAARASYREILSLEPDWPEALDAFAWFLFDASTQSLYHGSLRAAIADAEEMHVLATRRQFLAPTEPLALRLLSVAANQMGDVLIRRGQPVDAETALGHYQRSLEIDEKLLAANPDSAEAARDVSVSLERLGDFLATRGGPGDADTALGHFQRSLEVREKLHAANPDSAQAARDVSVSLNKLGDFLAKRGQEGDAATALGHYQRSLEVREKLLAANPDSAEAARDVSVSLNNLGVFLATRGQEGDAATALGHYQRSLELAEKLLAANPDSAQAARNVSVSLNRLGDFLATRGQEGDAATALGHYQRSLELAEKLLAANLDSAQAARDVCVSLNKLGDFLAKRGGSGDAETALGHYQRDLEISEKLLAANPDSAEAALDVAISHERLGDYCRDHEQPGEAEAHYRHSLETWERMKAANPDSAYHARGGVLPASRLAALAEQTGKGDAAAWWRRAYDILHGMEKKGMFLSQGDKEYLESLRGRVGGK